MKIAAKRIVTTAMLVAFLVVVGAGPALAQGERVNINTATVEELCVLERVGPTYAQRIVDYRTEYGLFQNPEDIMKVRGIG
ncbi:MAG: ComEA family DNA-binding protein, partial [Syntrophobacteria bacterium]